VTKICFAIEQKQNQQQKPEKIYRKECSKSKRSDSNKTVNNIFGFHQFFIADSFWFFFLVKPKEVGQKSKKKFAMTVERISTLCLHYGHVACIFSVVLSPC